MIGRQAKAAKWRAEIQHLKTALRQGSSIASNNIAGTYRQMGEHRRAFQWWMKTARASGGDAWLEVGYCQQYGIGTRRAPGAAINAYRRALRGTMSAYSEEETQYLLAVALLDRGNPRDSNRIKALLRLASGDGDYPQAAKLLQQLSGHSAPSVCRCRRFLARRLGGKSHCSIHTPPTKTRH